MAFSPHTHELLAAAGLKWHGDARDNDVPRFVNFKNGQMAHIPWSDFTDNRVLRSSSMAAGRSSPSPATPRCGPLRPGSPIAETSSVHARDRPTP